MVKEEEEKVEKKQRYEILEVAKEVENPHTHLVIQDNHNEVFLKNEAVLVEILNKLHEIKKSVVG